MKTWRYVIAKHNVYKEAAKQEYLLGHSQSEMKRLQGQADILEPITKRLFLEAGIVAGMRVLDVGCGAGDVSLLAARLMGSLGEVVGVDANPVVLDIARARAKSARIPNVEFVESTVEAFHDEKPFDAIVGRLFLIHQTTPEKTLSRVISLLRHGGIVAFHELRPTTDSFQSLPPAPLWDQVGKWIVTTVRNNAPHREIGGQLVKLFLDCGLMMPRVFYEGVVDYGSGSPLYAMQADFVRTLMPHMLRLGIATSDEIDIDSLQTRLERQVEENKSQIVWAGHFCGWAKKPLE
jgi:ubiquinone/menaquinone biosynthesis C-methylase UbiE